MLRSSPRALSALLLAVGLTALVAGCWPDHGKREAAFQALARWEDRRLAPEDSLLSLLASEDAHIRLRAVRSAGLIGRYDATGALIDALQDRSPTVARQAAFSLGLLGDTKAVPPLEAILAGHGDALRLAAIRGLAQLPHQGKALLKETAHPDARFAAAAWDALRRAADPGAAVYADSAAVAEAVIAGLGRTEPDVLWRVLRCGERVAGPGFVGRFAPHVHARESQVRVHALRALARCGDARALEAVLAGCEVPAPRAEQPPERTRIAVNRALGRLGHQAYDPADPLPHDEQDLLTEYLIDAAGSPVHHLATEALLAMGRIAGHFDLPPEAAEQESLLPVWRIRLARAALGQTHGGPPARRSAAWQAWAALRGLGARSLLEARLKDEPSPVVQAGLLTAMAPLGPEVFGALSTALREGSPAVRCAALEALDTWSTDHPERRDEVRDALTRAAADEDFTVVATACRLLAGHPERLSLIALVEAWDIPLPEGRAEVRRAILATLAAFGPGIMEGPWPGRDDGNEDPLRGTCCGLLREAFDAADLRIRLEARTAAEATGLLPAALIPTEASLRATLPAFGRRPDQPAVRQPFAAPRVHCETERGTFVIQLDGEHAPNTCAAFLDLISRGFYEGLSFHRVVPDFVVQGGDPRGDGWGGPGYTIRSEWSELPYTRAAVGIAHDGKDTGGSQFFVTLSEQPHLVGRYTIFGQVVEGMDVVDQIQVGDTFRFFSAR